MIRFLFKYNPKFKSSLASLNLRPAINEIDEDRKLCLSFKGKRNIKEKTVGCLLKLEKKDPTCAQGVFDITSQYLN